MKKFDERVRPGRRRGVTDPCRERAADSRAKRQPDKRETAAYIGDMAAGLAALARRHGLAALTYLLELVQMEAGKR
jgi:hypothetical protein